MSTSHLNLVVRLPLYLCWMLWVSTPFAAPNDPAPISDEILQKLPAMRQVPQPAFVSELQRHHAEISSLANDQQLLNPQHTMRAQHVATGKMAEVADSASPDAQHIALKAKLHELALMDKDLDQDPQVPDAIKAPLHERLSNLQHHIKALADANSAEERAQAGNALQALLDRLQPAKHSSAGHQSAFPGHGIELKKPNELPAHPQAKLPPAYLSQAPISDPIVLAMNGTTANIAAVLPPLSEPTTCAYTSADVADDGANVQITSEIRSLATSLGYSPVRIFEWVQQNIKFQPYYGVKQRLKLSTYQRPILSTFSLF